MSYLVTGQYEGVGSMHGSERYSLVLIGLLVLCWWSLERRPSAGLPAYLTQWGAMVGETASSTILAGVAVNSTGYVYVADSVMDGFRCSTPPVSRD